MNKLFSQLLVALLLPLSLSAQTMETDKSYRMGKLENGLTYYIRHNSKEPNLADFYIAQRVGLSWKSLASVVWRISWNTWRSTAQRTFKEKAAHWALCLGAKASV